MLLKDLRGSRNRRGQGMVEYIIIIVVVGIFCIGIFMALGKGTQSQVALSSQKLVGSREHDAALSNIAVQARVSMETSRANKMTQQ